MSPRRRRNQPDAAVTAAIGSRPFVLAVGTLERRKAVPTLIRAFAVVAADHPDVMLVVAGADGDDADAVTGAIAALAPDIRERVLRTGPVDATTKAWLVAHARVLAYPSLDEGFGFPLLEAQAAGLPIVATRAGSIPEVAGEGAELVEQGDVPDLAAGLARVIVDDTRRAQLIAAGHVNRTRFSWEDTATAMTALYRRLVEQHA